MKVQAASNSGYGVTPHNELLDEYEFECQGEDTAKEVAILIEKAIAAAGKYLKLSVELRGEGKVGKNWKETH
jgi:DNA polymerase I-like protein with 3'-5' exonuclease and polymerase domains